MSKKWSVEKLAFLKILIRKIIDRNRNRMRKNKKGMIQKLLLSYQMIEIKKWKVRCFVFVVQNGFFQLITDMLPNGLHLHLKKELHLNERGINTVFK